jgi:hypothetical protein
LIAARDNDGKNGLGLSISGVIGVVLACGIVTIFAVLSGSMWWARRRRERGEKERQAERFASFREGPDEENIPAGLEPVFDPASRPVSVIDEVEGMAHTRAPHQN